MDQVVRRAGAKGRVMRVFGLHELAISLDDLLTVYGVTMSSVEEAGDEGRLGPLERVAARVAGWAGLLEGRAVPSFGPFSTADGSRVPYADLFLNESIPPNDEGFRA